MSTLTCAIVEDDVLSLTVIQTLAKKTGLLDVKASFTSPDKAMQWLVDNEVDLLILDVEMPGMTGLELFRALSYKPEVIIVSANSEYAVEAYDLAIADYLLKPVKDYARFLTAINRVLSKSKKNVAKQDETLFVRIDSLLLKLNVDDILWVEAFGDYIKIHTPEKVHIVYSTLKNLNEKLPERKFVRVHRSYIVNITKITNIDPNNLEINNTIIPISGTYKEDFLKRISVL
jgi:DNA-binding LytR/AlgR family response regulator